MAYHSQMTFLYFDDFENGKQFIENTLGLSPVYHQTWATMYQSAEGAYLGAVDAKRGSVKSHVRGGFLVSLTVDDVVPHYDRLRNETCITDLTAIKIFEDIGVKSFFFKGPEGYDFEIQQFTDVAFDFTVQNGSESVSDLDAAELIAAEKAFNRDAAMHGAKGWAANFLETGQMLSKSGQVISGKDVIEKAMTPLFALKKIDFTWTPSYAELSKDGSLGYTYGTYKRAYMSATDEEVVDRGMYLTVWKRDAHGQWKVAVDVGN